MIIGTRILVLVVFGWGQLLAQPPRPSVSEWQTDLRTIVHTIDSIHPWPYRRITLKSFTTMTHRLNDGIPDLPPDRVVVELMKLVASLHDGHTELFPANQRGFDSWFPIRLFRFSDSLVITAVDSVHADLAGARVDQISGQAALDAADRVASLSGADNEWGARQNTGLLSNAGVMHNLQLSDGQTLELDVHTRFGVSKRVRLEARTTSWGDPAWMQRGEMFGPPGIAVITAFDKRPPLDYRRMSASLPLHLRNRIPIWFTWLPADSVLYVQSNFVQDFNNVSFAGVVDSMFATATQHPVRRLILDLRYNSGGDGSKVLQFVHGMIRHHELDTPGKFILLTGGKTFSAAVLWISQLREHTNVITIGEPAGAPRNHCGDALTIVLPKTGMELQVSSLRHYGTRSDDTSQADLPDFPISMTSGDYFTGRDPVLEFARHTPELRTIPQLALALGADSALMESHRRTAQFGRWLGWHAFQEEPMNSAGYVLLRAGKLPDAIAVFRANARAYGKSGNVWDSLGEGLLAAGDTTEAVISYRHAVSLDPGNQNAREILKRLDNP